MTQERWYKLVGRKTVPVESGREWAASMERGNHIIARDMVGPYLVSTIFLDFDHSHGRGPPLLFETMIFRDDSSTEEAGCRTSTYGEALKQHQAAVKQARLKIV
jgi:hypothetical protein